MANPLKFAQAMLNAGRGRGNQVIKPETVASMSKSTMEKLKVNMLRSALWLRTNKVVFFPAR